MHLAITPACISRRRISVRCSTGLIAAVLAHVMPYPRRLRAAFVLGILGSICTAARALWL